jgi:autotransporter-associated beta strand protein
MDIGQRGTGVTGTLNMSGSAVLNVSTADFRIGAGDTGQGGGNGYMTIKDTAQLNMLGANTFNVGDTGSNGSLTMNGGTITLSNGLFNVGTGNSGSTYSMGSLTINAGTLNVNNWIAIGQGGGTGTATMYGGTINKTGDGGIVLGSIGGTGTWTYNGGTINNNTALILGEYGTAISLPGSGTFYLNGGLVQATQVQAGTVTNPGTATGNFYFNGGTLQASAASTDFMTTVGAGATLAVKVQHNGAIIDTQNFSVTINQILAEDSSSTGGGLTKQGAGTLTITQNATYTGNTTVTGGILNMLNINTPAATVSVVSGAELIANSIVATTLNIGSGTGVVESLSDGPISSSSLSPVPEPGTLVLLATAALATAFAAWRRKK